MKKLFFAALVATVAVGGALSANAVTFYPAGSDSPITCEDEALVNCTSGLSTAIKYYAESFSQGQVTEIDLDDYQDLTRTN